MFDRYAQLKPCASSIDMDATEGSVEVPKKTSDFYKTHNLPARFECPSKKKIMFFDKLCSYVFSAHVRNLICVIHLMTPSY